MAASAPWRKSLPSSGGTGGSACLSVYPRPLSQAASKAILAFVGLLAAATAAAQTPASVHILSDDSQFLVGRSLQMRAVVRDSAGDPIPNAVVTWAINQTQAGSITTGGLVTARGLATFRVTARAGSVTGEAAIQSIPSRMEITPSSADLLVGSQMQFRAAAYDADGAPPKRLSLVGSSG